VGEGGGRELLRSERSINWRGAARLKGSRSFEPGSRSFEPGSRSFGSGSRPFGSGSRPSGSRPFGSGSRSVRGVDVDNGRADDAPLPELPARGGDQQRTRQRRDRRSQNGRTHDEQR